MKFAREFRTALVQEGFPARWVDTAIPYCQLKKCLKKVESELGDVGLDPITLKQFLDEKNIDYNLEETDDAQQIRPRLTVTVHLRDGVLVDAALTPATRTFLRSFTAANGEKREKQEKQGKQKKQENISSICSAATCSSRISTDRRDSEGEMVQKVEVPLVFDAQFFSILQSDIVSLSALQDGEEKTMSDTIQLLRSDLAKVAKPSKFYVHKDDMAVWREIFRLYLDANIFFSALESDHGSRSAEQAGNALKWWAGQVGKGGLVEKFRLAESKDVMDRFVGLNKEILLNLTFQQLNQRAVAKILKKFDKHTLLSSTPTYRLFSQTHNPSNQRLLASSVAKDMCSGISNELVPLVPQLQDYLCPICESIASFPMKPRCGHVVCSRCVNKMLRKKMTRCPLCRIDVTQKDNAPDVDWSREKLNLKYFPRETKEKHRADRLELGKDLHGDSYDPNECLVM